MASVKGIIVEIGGDTSKLQEALKKVNSSTSSLSKELKGVNSLLKLDPKNTELVSQKQEILKENIEQTSKKLEELQKVQTLADEKMISGGEISQENYRNLQREIINTENKLKNLQVEASKWTTAGRSIEEFGNKVTNISNKIDKMGTTITTRLTLPIAGIATAAIKTGNDFEAQMSRVQAIAGATKQELKLLTDQAIELGAKTSFNSQQVAEGMENLASAGFTTNEIMEAMPGLLDLAASSGAELATSSEITASAIRGFGLEANNAGHVADVFAEAAARTNAQTEDMGEAMKYVAPVAKTVGLSIEETAAAIGIMSDAGVKGSQAGTTLRGGLTRIIKPTKQVKEAMATLGVEFYDNNGKMKSLTEIIKTLQEHTKGLTDETKNQALAQIFGTEALSGMLALVNRGSDELSTMTKSFENCDGAAAEMAETMLDNTSGALESLSGSLESAGIVIQKALAPEIKKLAKWIQGLVDNFTDLSEEEQLNIIKTAALVAAIGPAVKILGTLGKTIGSGVKTIGSFSQAIALMGKTSTDAFKNASSSTQSLAKGLTFLTSPAGLATVAITAVAAGATYLALKQTEALRETNKLAEEISKSKQEYEEYNQSVDKTTNANLSQINSVSRLKDELTTLVDENGKVKEGYEGRVSFILNELNDALDTEYQLNDNVVQNYKDLQNEIDATIEKKRAEIKLEAYKQKYENAMNTETDAVAKQKEIIDQLGMSYEEVREKYGDWIDKYNNSTLTTGDIDNLTQAEYNHRAELAKLSKAYEEQESIVKQCTEDKKNYETNYALFVEGKYNEIGKTITDTTKNWTNSTLKEIQNSITQQQGELDKYKQIYEKTGSEVAQQQMQQAQQNLQNLANELAERTNTIGTLGIDEISAWQTLANNSYEEYKNALSKVGPTTQQEIQKATGIIASDTGLETASGNEAYNMTTNFDNKLKLGDKTKIEISDTATTINNDTSVSKAAEDLGQDIDTNFNNKLDGWTWGWDLVKNIYNGLTNSDSKSLISRGASAIGSIIDSFIGFSLPEKGPLSDFDKSMPDMIDLMNKGINSNKSKVINSAEKLAQELYSTLNDDMKFPAVRDFGKLQGSLSSQIVNSSKTIFTTPQINFNVQELDEAKLKQCFNYINRKFGSQY